MYHREERERETLNILYLLFLLLANIIFLTGTIVFVCILLLFSKNNKHYYTS